MHSSTDEALGSRDNNVFFVDVLDLDLDLDILSLANLAVFKEVFLFEFLCVFVSLSDSLLLPLLLLDPALFCIHFPLMQCLLCPQSEPSTAGLVA